MKTAVVLLLLACACGPEPIGSPSQIPWPETPSRIGPEPRQCLNANGVQVLKGDPLQKVAVGQGRVRWVYATGSVVINPDGCAEDWEPSPTYTIAY